MPTQAELLQEAYTRGILPPEKMKLYDEAVSRGLIQGAKQYDVTPETSKRLSELESVQASRENVLQKSIPPLPENATPEMKARYQEMYFRPSDELTRTRRMAELEQQGVTTNLDLPAGNVEMGFALDPVAGLQKSLSAHYKQPVKVYKDKEDILFIDPTDGKTKLANPDWISKLGQGIPIAGDIIGTVSGGAIGGIATRHPAGIIAGETAGSATGTGIGEAIRLSVGNALGVNDLTSEEITKEASIKGAEAGAATLATGGILATVKGVKNFVKGHIYTREEAAKYGLTQTEADEAIAEVNRLAGKEDAVKGTLGRKSNNVEAQSAEADVRRNIVHAQDFVDRDLADQAGLNKALENVTQPGSKQGGQAVHDVAFAQSEKRLSQGKKIVAANEAELKTQLDDIGKVTKENVGEPTRATILAKSEASKNAEKAAWADVEKVGGYNPEKKTYGIDIEQGDYTKAFKSELKERSRTATTKVVSKGTGSIYRDGAERVAKENKYAKNPEVAKIMERARTSSAKPRIADLANFNREISTLRKEMRAVTKNKQFGDPDTASLQTVIDSMVKDRRTALIKAGRKDVLDAIEAAELKTSKFHEVYDRSVIGDLTAKNKNGVYKIKDKDFVDKMLNADKDEVTQLMTVIGDSPSLVNQWKEGISEAYKRVAFPEGKFNAKASETFINKYRQNLNAIGFKDAELDKFARVGGLSQKVEKQSKQLNELMKNANNKWGKGKLKSLDPDNLVKFVTNDSGSWSRVVPEMGGIQSMSSKIDYVKNITKNYPAAWNAFKKEYSTGVHESVFDINKNQINPKKLNQFLHDNEKVIEKVMGRQYLTDLKSINEVSKILSKPLKSLSGSEQRAGVLQLGRSIIAPPLTRRGRAFTAAVIFENKANHDAIARAMLEPTSMHDLAKLSHHSKITRETVELAASLGIIIEQPNGGE